jgi:GcrA cell cycle regulator
VDEEIRDEAIERTAAGWRPIERPQEWTAEDRAKLREMYASGSRLKAIAKALGRTTRAVDNKLVRLGLRPRISRTYQEVIWTPEQIGELRELCADARLSAGDIAAQIGKTRNAVIGKSNRLGITRAKKRPAKPKNRPAVRSMASTPVNGISASLAIPVEDRRILDEAERFVTPASAPKVKHAPGNKTFFELGARDCRFPLGKPMEPATLFCGAVTVAVLAPYCHEHSRLCGVKYARSA